MLVKEFLDKVGSLDRAIAMNSEEIALLKATPVKSKKKVMSDEEKAEKLRIKQEKADAKEAKKLAAAQAKEEKKLAATQAKEKKKLAAAQAKEEKAAAKAAAQEKKTFNQKVKERQAKFAQIERAERAQLRKEAQEERERERRADKEATDNLKKKMDKYQELTPSKVSDKGPDDEKKRKQQEILDEWEQDMMARFGTLQQQQNFDDTNQPVIDNAERPLPRAAGTTKGRRRAGRPPSGTPVTAQRWPRRARTRAAARPKSEGGSC